MVNDTRSEMGNKPVIVLVDVLNPMVFSEIEKNASAILVHFGVQDQALMDIVTGAAEPSGLLPFQMPADMKTVEEQYEDVPRDMNCYVDFNGNKYDFGFGLNWSGVINDERLEKYRK
jgi:beta-glucosidase